MEAIEPEIIAMRAAGKLNREIAEHSWVEAETDRTGTFMRIGPMPSG